MGNAAWWLMLIGVAVLLVVLIWLVIKTQASRKDPVLRQETAEGTRELYTEEDERRREGTDKAEK